jgi:hypothetical protein
MKHVFTCVDGFGRKTKCFGWFHNWAKLEMVQQLIFKSEVQNFNETYYLLFGLFSILQMEAVRSSETSENAYKNELLHNPVQVRLLFTIKR